MKPFRGLLFIGILLITFQSLQGQGYRYYFFSGDDAEQVNPIWGWNGPFEYPFEIGGDILEKFEENKLIFSAAIAPNLSYENIYMRDQLLLAVDSVTGVAAYVSDTNPNRTYESRFLSYQSKHRFVRTGLNFYGYMFYNSFALTLGIQPSYMIGGDIKLRYSENGSRERTRNRYKDNDYYNLNRFQFHVCASAQFSYIVVSYGADVLPMFKADLGPNLFKQYLSIGFTIPMNKMQNFTKAFDFEEPKEKTYDL